MFLSVHCGKLGGEPLKVWMALVVGILHWARAGEDVQNTKLENHWQGHHVHGQLLRNSHILRRSRSRQTRPELCLEVD